MTRKDHVFLVPVFLVGVFIWTRDRRWTAAAEDALPILAALPLFIWLAAPWRWRKGGFEVSNGWLFVAVATLMVGHVSGLTTVLTMGWGMLGWSWLSLRLEEDSLRVVRRLLPLPLLAMPWVTLDGDVIGWWFRLSGAWVTANLFSMLGFTVTHSGTLLNIQGAPISVEAACAGLNTLQSMLIAGVALAFVILGRERCYWWNIALLVPLAWLANTLRILMLSGAALSFSPEFVAGKFHDLSGWVVIVTMFLLCHLLFTLEAKWKPKTA